MDNNRQIKFRAVIDGKVGESFNPFDPVFMASGGTFPERTIFEQFTGLTDKEGKEIFEGDRLKSNSGREGIVKFENGSFTWLGDPLGWEIDGEETKVLLPSEWALIVGTIHQ